MTGRLDERWGARGRTEGVGRGSCPSIEVNLGLSAWHLSVKGAMSDWKMDSVLGLDEQGRRGSPPHPIQDHGSPSPTRSSLPSSPANDQWEHTYSAAH